MAAKLSPFLCGICFIKLWQIGWNYSQHTEVAPARMATMKTWGRFWQLAVSPPSAPQPPSKLSHLVENRSDLAKRKLERGREGRNGGKGGRGGWAEASSQSLELWLWEKTVTLSSQSPLDQGGILSLCPLGLEKATEGYFLRSEAKEERVGRTRKEKKGERGGWRDFLSLRYPGWKMNRREGTTQSDKNTKQQQNTNTTHRGNPPSHLFTPRFPQQKQSTLRLRRLWVTVRATQSKDTERSTVHKTFRHFNVLPPSYTAFSLVKATQNKQLSKGSWEAKAQLNGRAQREKKAFKETRVQGPCSLLFPQKLVDVSSPHFATPWANPHLSVSTAVFPPTSYAAALPSH